MGTRAGLPHWLSVALLFPHVLGFNAPSCRDKTAEVLAALGLTASVEPQAVRDSTGAYCSGLGIGMSLGAHGVREADLRPRAEEPHGIRRLTDNNPRHLRPRSPPRSTNAQASWYRLSSAARRQHRGGWAGLGRTGI